MTSFLWKPALAGTPDAAPGTPPAEETNLEGVTGRLRRRRRPARPAASLAVWILALAGMLSGENSPAQQPVIDSPGGFAGVDGPAYDPGLSGWLGRMRPPPLFPFSSFYVDYRIRRFSDSHVTYEFGDPDPAGPNPLSRLEFPISSTWNGLELGLEDPRWAVRAEWLTPWSEDIDGDLRDTDWFIQNVQSHFGTADQRWIDAHTVDVAFEMQLLDSQLGVPFSVWPVGGFRWQKFDIMTYNLKQWQYDFFWPVQPYTVSGNVIRFRQEYHYYYVGGQLRIDIPPGGLLPGVSLTFQGDWGKMQGFNFDHHLLRGPARITRENTHGDASHFGVTAEIFLTDYFSVGVEGEYTVVRMAGTHHLTHEPYPSEPYTLDWKWSRGVHVTSEQTAITVFLRLRR